ncbi:hypothetical protein BASA50_007713 [Batrachochytrium salamandrivorans]|uniref:RRM domain-containing protein n=1 Tax=Batrachochytrium salamandrivorans TaxID=1357716 RepID=A0ABQ8F9K2_9FUNG|nr:hypothetical protein BASA62_010249 [Batrachochytrium salamandrivorans]KAH6574546.1 hypothetical protein BASA60_005453 [Batrachochytrium salamandrivorans]KAH6592986.1 hypothetical protein BASA50_007713 [Batrachochytrium salamandrivorans]KAH6593533.1 hypothetical protein BASA61_004270 [Batrachochytrium salamandrivorans]KAH9271926.1 hypothetical protein BASA83_005764 [Batrachochytrium salamandrivorans]
MRHTSVKDRLGPKTSGRSTTTTTTAAAGSRLSTASTTGSGVFKKTDLRSTLAGTDLRRMLSKKNTSKGSSPVTTTTAFAAPPGSRLAGRLGKQSDIHVTINAAQDTLGASTFSTELSKRNQVILPPSSGPLKSRISRMAVNTTSSGTSSSTLYSDAIVASPSARMAAVSTSSPKSPAAIRSCSGFAIQVSNLHPDTSTADLKVAFESFGLVRQVEMLNNLQQSTSLSALVVYDQESHGRAAIAQYNNTLADGRILKVEHVQRGLSIAGIATNSTGKSLIGASSHSLPRESRTQQNQDHRVETPTINKQQRQQHSQPTISNTTFLVGSGGMYADREAATRPVKPPRIPFSATVHRGPKGMLATAVAAAARSVSHSDSGMDITA